MRHRLKGGGGFLSGPTGPVCRLLLDFLVGQRLHHHRGLLRGGLLRGGRLGFLLRAGAGGRVDICVDIARRTHFGDLGLVLLDLLLGGGDFLAQGGVGPLGGHAPLGVVEFAQVYIGFADGVLLGGGGDVQLGNVRELLGLGRAGLGQVQRLGFQVVKRKNKKNLPSYFAWGF